ncbi:unnamed protein product [Orchesella dallaii]|uniref:Integral membrane protein DGCR2/IDD n=1 Tax=Orchesella dallaii TaxID=48710 RepID=A0ABP1RYQ6_9HEXA
MDHFGFGVLATPSGDDLSGFEEEYRRSKGKYKHCIDINQKLIPHGVHYAPESDQCCTCDDGEPKWCKAVLCEPPEDCKSFKVGRSCCDFICMDKDDPIKPILGGPYLPRPRPEAIPAEVEDFLPKVGIGAAMVVLSMLLFLFFLYRRRQHRIHGEPISQSIK